jgi:hypothetical protein
MGLQSPQQMEENIMNLPKQVAPVLSARLGLAACFSVNGAAAAEQPCPGVSVDIGKATPPTPTPMPPSALPAEERRKQIKKRGEGPPISTTPP